ncbi:MAG: response regulator [Phycisphaerales bacterium JB039]
MSAIKHILVVEDHRDLVELLEINLRSAGYQVSSALDGRTGLAKARSLRPNLLILDLMLPHLSGDEVARRLRSEPATASLPIIMLTAKADEADQVSGLATGADDYITKPFSMKVLLARVQAVLRRASEAGAPELLSLGPIEIDTSTHQVRVAGELVQLTLTEFRLLASLIMAGGRVLSRAELMTRAMGPGVLVTERTIDVHITALRRKLGPAAALIQTVRGVGYRASQANEPSGVAD